MPFRRRRPLARAALVGGVAYQAGKRIQQNRDQEAYDAQYEPEPAASGGLTDEKLRQLEKLGELKQQGILSEVEFEVQKAKLLAGP